VGPGCGAESIDAIGTVRRELGGIVNRYLVVTAAALAGAAVLTSFPAGARALTGVTVRGGTWGTAQEVPGTAALNQGGGAGLNAVSCGSAGNCTAGGFYTDRSGHPQAFVASQVHGTWGAAREVPGTAKLNLGGNAGLNAVSCGSAGNCTAGGFFTDRPGHMQVFVVSRTSRPAPPVRAVPGRG
jgi:hypothetical protein